MLKAGCRPGLNKAELCSVAITSDWVRLSKSLDSIGCYNLGPVFQRNNNPKMLHVSLSDLFMLCVREREKGRTILLEMWCSQVNSLIRLAVSFESIGHRYLETSS